MAGATAARAAQRARADRAGAAAVVWPALRAPADRVWVARAGAAWPVLPAWAARAAAGPPVLPERAGAAWAGVSVEPAARAVAAVASAVRPGPAAQEPAAAASQARAEPARVRADTAARGEPAVVAVAVVAERPVAPAAERDRAAKAEPLAPRAAARERAWPGATDLPTAARTGPDRASSIPPAGAAVATSGRRRAGPRSSGCFRCSRSSSDVGGANEAASDQPLSGHPRGDRPGPNARASPRDRC